MLYPLELQQLDLTKLNMYILYNWPPLSLNSGEGKDLIIEFD